jgi:hypothetical protein
MGIHAKTLSEVPGAEKTNPIDLVALGRSFQTAVILSLSKDQFGRVPE